MIVVMKTGATEGQILAVQKRVRELGFKDHLSRGDERTVIGVLGAIHPDLQDEFIALDGVDSVVRISKPFKLAAGRSRRRIPSSRWGRWRLAAAAL